MMGMAALSGDAKLNSVVVRECSVGPLPLEHVDPDNLRNKYLFIY